MIQNRRIALIVRLGFFIVAFVGLSIHTRIFTGDASPGIFMYYTIQSNLLALVLFGMLTVRTFLALKREGRIGSCSFFPRFEMVCSVDLFLTFVVYWVMLAPQAFTMGSSYSLLSFDNLSVHLITPLACLVDYVLFTTSKHLKYRDVYAVAIFPLAYVAFTSIAGFLGYTYYINPADGLPVRFPYFFFDYDRIGLMAFAYIGALLAFFLALSHGLYFLDKKWKKPVLTKR